MRFKGYCSFVIIINAYYVILIFIITIVSVLLLLFIPGKNPMGLYGKLLYYICLGKPFGEKIYAFFAP